MQDGTTYNVCGMVEGNVERFIEECTTLTLAIAWADGFINNPDLWEHLFDQILICAGVDIWYEPDGEGGWQLRDDHLFN